MERLHLHAMQQLQHELTDARERSGTYTDEPHVSQTNSKDVSQFGQNSGNQLDVNGSGASSAGVLPNGNTDTVPPFVSTGNASGQVRVWYCCCFVIFCNNKYYGFNFP